MIDKNTKDIITRIKSGEIDINNQSLFFPLLIEGLLLKLNKDLTIRNIPIPHYILHTGDDIMYLEHKGQDSSIEPKEISNENYVYNIIPRCIVTPNSIDMDPDQLTNPYTKGNLEFEYYDEEGNPNIYSLTSEFRRMPVKFSCELKYYVDSYRDLMELVQQIMTKLAFIQTYYITYLGQQIICSYKIPESISGEYLTELDGMTTDSKYRTISISLEIESNLPIYSPQTVMHTGNYINLCPKASGLQYGDGKNIGVIHGMNQIGLIQPDLDIHKYVDKANPTKTDDDDNVIYTPPLVNISPEKP